LALCATASLGYAEPATAATRAVLYVGNKPGDDITIIDIATQKVMSTLKVGALVHGICAQGDGRKAFVTIESNNTLKVLDTKSNTLSIPSTCRAAPMNARPPWMAVMWWCRCWRPPTAPSSST
jgi:YVTN family beta-propeller protein